MESGFKRAFATLFGQDIETFTGTMFLYVEQLEKHLDKEDFQKIGCMAAFNSIDERVQLKREYDSWVNERQMQITEEKVDTSKALYASLVDTKSSGIESKKHDTSSRSGNDAHDDDADIRPIYYEEPMAESQFLKEKSNEAKVKHDIDVLETINIELEHTVAKLLKENESLKKNYKELFDSIKIMKAKTTKHTTSLIATNDKFKAQLQEKGFAIGDIR
nr:actin-binding, cofilin/tropomyosin type [Tanacetum cinerariifolium]